MSEEREQTGFAMPLAGVSVCVIRDQRALLVKRGNRLGRNLWSLPGGKVEIGEPVRAAALRELKEETGITAEITRLLDCIDIINKDAQGTIRAHYVLSVFGARWVSGNAQAASDALAVQWVTEDGLSDLQMTPGTIDLIRKIMRRNAP